MEKPKKKLLDQVREAIYPKHYSKRTEEAYTHRIKRYIFLHNKRHPLVETFLTHLAIKKQVSVSTQNQAFSALLFLYREMLNKPLEGPINSFRTKRPRRLPTVLTKEALKVIQCSPFDPAQDGRAKCFFSIGIIDASSLETI